MTKDFDDRMIQAELAELRKGHKSWSRLDTKGKTAYIYRAMGREHGQRYLVANAESYNAGTQRSCDMFGLFDLIVITGTQTIGVQATGSDWAEHINRYRTERLRAALHWLECPSRSFEQWGWRRIKGWKKDGTRTASTILTPKVQVITAKFLLGKEDATMIYPFSERN